MPRWICKNQGHYHAGYEMGGRGLITSFVKCCPLTPVQSVVCPRYCVGSDFDEAFLPVIHRRLLFLSLTPQVCQVESTTVRSRQGLRLRPFHSNIRAAPFAGHTGWRAFLVVVGGCAASIASI